MPARIQRKRTRGWRLPEGAVIVDRTSRFGNPFRIVTGVIVEDPADGRVWTCDSPQKAQRWASELYAAWLDGLGPDTYRVGRRTLDRRITLAALGAMRGHDLACTCEPPEPGEPDHCHGAYLIRRANTRRPRTEPVQLDGGGTRHTTQRCCNGCGREVGDVTDWEMACAMTGRELPDVRGECPHCTPTRTLETR